MESGAPNYWERLFIFLQTAHTIKRLSISTMLSLSRRFNVEPETFFVLIKFYGYEEGRDKVC